MSFFKKSRKYGPIVLATWLIASGGIALTGASVPYSGPVLAILMIAAGVLILIDL